MDDMQHEPRVAQEPATTTSGETPAATGTVLGTRALANPRRVRRA